MGVSGAVKNYMGVPSDKLTPRIGGQHINSVDKGGMGTEMAETRFPAITILDAIWINAVPGKARRLPMISPRGPILSLQAPIR